MALKTFKPITPGRRQMAIVRRDDITSDKPLKSLVKGKKRISARNNHGRITVRFRGGGHKRRYRIIDFKRNKDGVPARVASIEYDPNRTARIALLVYRDGEKRYILAPDGLKVGDEVLSGDKAEPRVGNCLPLSRVPIGMTIHAVELKPGRGAQLVRAAGASAVLLARESGKALIQMPSGEVRMVDERCRATIGAVGNMEHSLEKSGKAGRSRWLGRRPHVRGVAQNPVDHPMGGGEGRTSGGRHPCSPWGQPAKGFNTRPKHKYSDKWIVRRRGRKGS